MPGIIYKFENQHLNTFADNYRVVGEVSFAIYFDLETTCGKEEFGNVGKGKMYPVSYCLVVAFHPVLRLDRITVLASFNHSFDQLVDISYFSDEMIRYFNPITA